MTVAIAEFKEGGRHTRYMVTTDAIKNFDAASPPQANDPKEIRDVKWQKSFHGDDTDGSSHDGYFPGKILLVAGESLLSCFN